MVARVIVRLRRRLDRCYGKTAGFSRGLTPSRWDSLSRCNRATGAWRRLAAFGRTTRRRHDDNDEILEISSMDYPPLAAPRFAR
jgi:hypothetical protein